MSWMDDSSSEDEDDEYATSDGDVLGYAQATRRGSSSNGADQLGSESPWKLDVNALGTNRVRCFGLVDGSFCLADAWSYFSLPCIAHRRRRIPTG